MIVFYVFSADISCWSVYAFDCHGRERGSYSLAPSFESAVEHARNMTVPYRIVQTWRVGA